MSIFSDYITSKNENVNTYDSKNHLDNNLRYYNKPARRNSSLSNCATVPSHRGYYYIQIHRTAHANCDYKHKIYTILRLVDKKFLLHDNTCPPHYNGKCLMN